MDISSSPGVLARLSIAQKIILLFAINAMVAIAISSASVFYLNIISHELEQIAHEDLPLTQQLTEITSHQLEQAIHLERAIRHGELLALGQPTAAELDAEIAYFKKLTLAIKKDISNIDTMIVGFLKKNHQPATIAELEKVQKTIKGISTSQAEIASLADDTFALLKNGELDTAIKQVKVLTDKEDKLDAVTQDLLVEFEAFTAASMELANQHEIEAKQNITYMSIGFILLASAISLLVYRSVAIPLHSMKESLTALEDAKTLALPPFPEDTELGKIYHSISIIGNNFSAINRTQAGVFVDLNGKIEHANRKFLTLLDYTLDEISRKRFSTLLSPGGTDQTPWDQKWATIIAGQPLSGEYELTHKNGRSCWIQATFNPIVGLNGKTSRVVIYSIDITEEVSQRKEIAMISLVASKTDNSVVITDANERIEYVNEGFTRITGYTLDEALGKKPGRLLQGEKTNPETVADVRRKVSSKEPFYDEILNYNKSGQPYWVSLAINPVFDDQGNLIRFVSIQGEVTENKLRNLENERGMRESVAVLEALAQGKLNQPMVGDYKGTFQEISVAINGTVDNLVDVVQRIRMVASTVDTAAREINAGNADLISRSESAAASLEETSTSMEEITITVEQNAKSSAHAKELALGAHEEAEKGGKIVSHAVSAMVDINDSSKRIADITGVIDDIAFQTNLLALNASVEAARAGEQGRGFAVVASEVRNLAGRSAEAAKEIKELIGDSVKRVENGVELVNETGETLVSIVTRVKKVADIVADITSASQEQADGVKQVHNAIVQIDKTTQQNASLVEQASAASQSTTEQAENLIELIEFFDTGSTIETTANAHQKKHTDTQPYSANDTSYRKQSASQSTG